MWSDVAVSGSGGGGGEVYCLVYPASPKSWLLFTQPGSEPTDPGFECLARGLAIVPGLHDHPPPTVQRATPSTATSSIVGTQHRGGSEALVFMQKLRTGRPDFGTKTVFLESAEVYRLSRRCSQLSAYQRQEV